MGQGVNGDRGAGSGSGSTARNYGHPNCVKDSHCAPCALLFATAREAPMKMARPDVETLAAVIGHSQIVVAASRQLPVDFDEVDIAILDWIIAESRLVGLLLADVT